MKNKGVTLIVLAITIIILLILAVITILTLTGENGLIAKTIKSEIEDIEISYSLSLYKNNIFKMNMIITSKNSMISEIKLPENDTLKCNNRNVVSIDYEFEENVDYTFIIKTADGKETTEVANFKMPTEEIDRNLYYIMKLYEINREIEVDWRKDEYFLYYYKLVGEENWNLYTGEIIELSEIAEIKTVHKKCADIYIESNVKYAINELAFDGDVETSFLMNTYPNPNEAYTLIDNELWNEEIEINLTSVYYSMSGKGVYVQFIDFQNQIINTILLGNSGTFIKKILVPENARLMKICYGSFQGPVYINEITVCNEPKIKKVEAVNAKISNDKMEGGCVNVEIEYKGSCIKQLYKIGEKEWKEYKGSIELRENSTIYAKGINEKGIESRILTEDINFEKYTVLDLSFDDNDTTYSVLNNYPNPGKFYIEIDEAVIGKKLEFNISNIYYSINGQGANISFVDENFNNIKLITNLSNYGTTFKGTDVEIPSNSKYIEISISGYGGPVSVYEIKIKD